MADEGEETADFHQAFLIANTNLDSIADRFSDVLRNLMRAFAAHDPAAATYRAVEQMNLVAELLSKTHENIGFYALFTRALECMDKNSERSDIDKAIIDAAKSGLKFLVERSCDDNAARGRSSRRQREFLDDMRRIEEARDEARRKWDRR